MTIEEFLRAAINKLKKAGIGTARLDSLVLLEDALGKDRAWLLANPDFRVQKSVLNTLNTQIAIRTKHIPLAYIRGKTEFYGREFAINQDVLEPRPESETIIDLLKTTVKDNFKNQNKQLQIIDIGTGSGALAITAKLELPDVAVIATDVDHKSLAIARDNARKYSVKIKFYQGDLLQPILPLLSSRCILLCNLPYVPNDFKLNKAAMNEPRHAIFGGDDGLDLYRRLFSQLSPLAPSSSPQFYSKNQSILPFYILTESLPSQHKTMTDIATKAGYEPLGTDDFIIIFKSTA